MGKLGAFQISGSMQVRIFKRRYSSSRRPYARRWITRILLFKPSTNPRATLFSLDKLAARATHSGVFALAHLIQGLVELAQHVKLVAQNRRLWGVVGLKSRGPKRRPHIHHGQPNPRALLGAQPPIEQIPTRFSPILTAEPESTPACQVADHNAVRMPFAERTLVNPNTLCGPGVPARRTCSRLYCWSHSWTVRQSKCSSRATSWR